jgi:hypothetical protein
MDGWQADAPLMNNHDLAEIHAAFVITERVHGELPIWQSATDAGRTTSRLGVIQDTTLLEFVTLLVVLQPGASSLCMACSD